VRQGPLLLAAAAALLLSGAASAQSWPSRPIKFIVGTPAGGGNDTVGRVVANRIGDSLGQPVIVENRPGASQMIAAEATAKAPPDGYTFMVVTQTTVAVTPYLTKVTAFDPLKDFAPVVLIGQTPQLLVVHPSVPVNSVAELIEYARAKKGELDFASGGIGSSQHMAGELFGLMTGVKLTHIAYKGEQPALADVIGGQVPMGFANMPTVMPHVQSGAVRALAATSKERAPTAPQLPTVSESGLPGFDVQTWFGLVAPAKTPPEIISRLNAEVVRAVSSGEGRERLLAQGINIVGSTPEAFGAHIVAETAKWGKVIKDADIRAE
jgi:tripartite-type tricarboxylate transporter receptor subunit TctC